MDTFRDQLVQQAFLLVVTIGGGVLITLFTGLAQAARRWLEAHGHATASAALQSAADIVQQAMQNEAGVLALKVQTGQIKLEDVEKLANIAAQRVAGRVPEAMDKLEPVPGAVANAIVGKVGVIMASVPPPAAAPVLVQAPPLDVMPKGSYAMRAAWLTRHLQIDLAPLKDFQAAGLVGNLGEESGLEAVDEVAPAVGRGGTGWAQWTGSRRVAFESWCAAKGLSSRSDEANYGFLLVELNGAERAALEELRSTGSLEEATRVVEQKFERAGVVRMDRRLELARAAQQELG